MSLLQTNNTYPATENLQDWHRTIPRSVRTEGKGRSDLDRTRGKKIHASAVSGKY